MRWHSLFGLFAIALTAVALTLNPTATTPTVQANDVATDTQSSFELRIDLSQTQRVMTVSLSNGAPHAFGAYEIQLTHCVGDTIQTSFALHPFQLDAFGAQQIVLPLQFDPNVTNFLMHVSAFHDSFGQTVHVHTAWRYGTKLVNEFSEVDAISSIASAALLGVGGDVAVDASAGGTNGEDAVASFAFASFLTAADGSFVLSGPGNYMAAGPPLQFSVTSGPTGVFTAN